MTRHPELMWTWVRLVLLLMLAFPVVSSADVLPFYSDSSLTPRWSKTEFAEHREPPFKAVNQLGLTVERAQLAGKVHVVNFFFTTCPGICPMTMFNLKRVQDALEGSDAQILSFSITPKVDKPEKLLQYADAKGIDAEYWQLLTGDAAQITELAEAGFWAVLDRNVKAGKLAHTEKAFLVDRDGYVRGVYNATSVADVMRLVEDLQILL